MKTPRIITVAVLIVGSGLAPKVAQSQQVGIVRTDLQRHDLSAPGREVVQVRVDIAPGVLPPITVIRAKRSSTLSKDCLSISLRVRRR